MYINYLYPGIKTSAPDIFSRKNLGKYSKYFIHTLGHGVGKRIHEAPKLWYKSRHYFRENMVVTVEPGIYIKNKLGIRIEDTILITKDGSIILTNSPKDLLFFKW